MEQRGKWEQLISSCLQKSCQIILQSRVRYRRAPPHERKLGTLFNLQIEDVEEFRLRGIDPFRMLNLEVSLSSPHQYLAGSPADLTDDLLLENWTFSFEAGPSKARMEVPIVYKKAVLFIRSLICQMRVLPAYQLMRAMRRDPESATKNSVIQHHFFQNGNCISEVTPNRDSLRFDSVPGPVEKIQFSPIETPIGRLLVSVAYRVNLRRKQPRSSVMLPQPIINSDCIISDYITQTEPDASKPSSRLVGGGHSGDNPHRRVAVSEPTRRPGQPIGGVVAPAHITPGAGAHAHPRRASVSSGGSAGSAGIVAPFHGSSSMSSHNSSLYAQSAPSQRHRPPIAPSSSHPRQRANTAFSATSQMTPPNIITGGGAPLPSASSSASSNDPRTRSKTLSWTPAFADTPPLGVPGSSPSFSNPFSPESYNLGTPPLSGYSQDSVGGPGPSSAPTPAPAPAPAPAPVRASGDPAAGPQPIFGFDLASSSSISGRPLKPTTSPFRAPDASASSNTTPANTSSVGTTAVEPPPFAVSGARSSQHDADTDTDADPGLGAFVLQCQAAVPLQLFEQGGMSRSMVAPSDDVSRFHQIKSEFDSFLQDPIGAARGPDATAPPDHSDEPVSLALDRDPDVKVLHESDVGLDDHDHFGDLDPPTSMLDDADRELGSQEPAFLM